jgi:hypothetical protein
MHSKNAWIAALAIAASALASGCSESTAVEAATDDEPAKVERIGGGDLHRLTLTQRAVERLDIKTAEVGRGGGGAGRRLTVPYGAVLYDPHGATFTYTNPEPLVYERAPIEVDAIKAGVAVLADGPPAGSAVVTVGGAELYGAEVGVGH